MLDQVLKMRDQNIRASSASPAIPIPRFTRQLLETHDFDRTQMALEAGLVGLKNGKGGMIPNDAIKTSFKPSRCRPPIARRWA